MHFLHAIQHTSADYLGLMEDHLEGRRIRFRYFRPFTEQGTVPQPGELCDGLFLLGGGPWGSAGERDVPSLEAEVRYTRALLDEGKPVVGIGLGAQILARAAGGGSEPAPLAFEVGELVLEFANREMAELDVAADIAFSIECPCDTCDVDLTIGAVGPVGPTGAQGEQGKIGPQGDQGEQGKIGPQGIQGPQGHFFAPGSLHGKIIIQELDKS